VPVALYGKISRLLLPDPALPSGTLPNNDQPVTRAPPANASQAYSPRQLARAYGLAKLHSQGYRGANMSMGIIAGETFLRADVQSMWQSFGVNRMDAVSVDTMEPQRTRDLEPTGDVELAAALAPDAEIIFYGGPDISDTSLIYTYNEAIGLGQVQVLSDSFSHAEFDSSASAERTYNESAMMAAALGITVVSASGDSAQVDIPSASPYVTAVGATNLIAASDGTWEGETSWSKTGCGDSRLFALPAWQNGIVRDSKGSRAVVDLAMAQGPYWIMYQGKWKSVEGTSCSSAVMAGLLTVVNHARQGHGKAPLGYLNPLLYQNSATRSSFRDIMAKDKGTGGCDVGPGYDLATGVGSPEPLKMVMAIP
jgi:kumamolisin